MAIYDLFSKRQKRLRGEVPDVYKYDFIPHQLRVQILYILTRAIGVDNSTDSDYAKGFYEFIDETLCCEYGRLTLTGRTMSSKDSTETFLLQGKDTEEVLSLVEMAFRLLDTYAREELYQRYTTTRMTPDEAISDLNVRFQEHGIGYQYESRRIIRVDSLLVHSEVVKPTLELLMEDGYQGANEEFLKAHEHYRHERHKECLSECLKAFESTMKIICTKRNWAYGENDGARELLSTCFANDLMPKYLQSHFAGIRSTLESGVPTIRNKRGGHGQGPKPTKVSRVMASYMLHLTATSILFLVQSEKEIS